MLAVVMGFAALIIAVTGGDLTQVVGFGVYGLILAVLSPKS